MNRNTDYQFVSTEVEPLVSKLIAGYESFMKTTVHPASPVKLFLMWLANIIIQLVVHINYVGNQNTPSRAVGENLDALGDFYKEDKRPDEQAARTTQRCYINSVKEVNVLIASGSKFTDTSKKLIWESTADVYIPAGLLYVDVMLQCQTKGEIGNNYEPGQINVALDPYDHFEKCENITKSDGGSDKANDDEYYNLMRSSKDAYSTAGARGAYIYFAKRVSTQISDVVANSPSAAVVKIYALMKDGTIAGTEIKNAILTACSSDYVRPLGEQVLVDDALEQTYKINFTYYISNSSDKKASELRKAVEEAVETYKKWQSEKLGRDINPAYLNELLMKTGIKRAVITEPAFQVLNDGENSSAPQIAKHIETSINDGGFEDE